MDRSKLPFVLAITGASGSIYGLRLLQYFAEVAQPVDLVISKAALRVMSEEMDLVFREESLKSELTSYLSLPKTAPLNLYGLCDWGAAIASGSYRTKGMAVAPCSLGTLGALAGGLTENLIHRAAAVCLKERRKLVVLVREMPFGHIQLKNMLALSEAGAILACASPGFYHRPQSVADMVDFVVGRLLDQLDFDHSLFRRWKEERRPLPGLKLQSGS